LSFVCYVCASTIETIEPEAIDRETAICPVCGSNTRCRALAYLAGVALFDARDSVAAWPVRRDIKAYGVSDWPPFAKYFSPKISYTNTQFDRSHFSTHPMLDITNPRTDWANTADLVICSEVLEHVEPPVERAFTGLAALLKPGGYLVFSVPYGFGDTVEHFPELFKWTLEGRDDRRVLVNVTRDGRTQRFDNLRFHGGGANVLEMRIFGLPSIERHLDEAGFARPTIMDYDILDRGIRFANPWSLPILAQKR
jgi:SAM-dependent methyltransferase